MLQKQIDFLLVQTHTKSLTKTKDKLTITNRLGMNRFIILNRINKQKSEMFSDLVTNRKYFTKSR